MHMNFSLILDKMQEKVYDEAKDDLQFVATKQEKTK